MNKRLCLAVVGPTASGKSELAVRIAKQFNGEIISADSRQIYRGMDIGSGKVEGKWETIPFPFHPGSNEHSENSPGSHQKHSLPSHPEVANTSLCSCHPELVSGSPSESAQIHHPERSGGSQKKVYLYKNIHHYLIDEASPRVQFSVSRFQKLGAKVMRDIIKRGKLSIICGGTGMWIDALLYNQSFPQVKPDPKLRKALETKSTAELYEQLLNLDSARAQNIDRHNPRRLVRALEIILTTGKPIPRTNLKSPYKTVWVGLNPGEKQLHANIATRLHERVDSGMITEVQNLHNQGMAWKRLESFGLEYKYCAMYLQGKLTLPEMKALLEIAIRQYAKRQMTWWKRNKDIHWFETADLAIAHFSDILRNSPAQKNKRRQNYGTTGTC